MSESKSLASTSLCSSCLPAKVIASLSVDQMLSDICRRLLPGPLACRCMFRAIRKCSTASLREWIGKGGGEGGGGRRDKKKVQ